MLSYEKMKISAVIALSVFLACVVAEKIFFSSSRVPTQVLASMAPHRANFLQKTGTQPIKKNNSRPTEETPLINEARERIGRDAVAILEWVNNLPDDSQFSEVLSDRIFQEKLWREANDRMKTAKLKNDGRSVGDLQNLVNAWAQIDLISCYRWVQNQSEGVQRDRLMEKIALIECQYAPDQAVALVQQQISSSIVREEATLSVLNAWACQDSMAAKAWVKQLPRGELQSHAMTELDEMYNE